MAFETGIRLPWQLWVLCLLALAITVNAQEKASDSFAEVSLIPGQTIIVVRDPQGADQAIVTTFFWQKIPGIEKPIMRNITAVVPVIKDTAVGADGAPDPKDVATVHVSLVRITSRMEWRPSVAEKENPSK